MKRVFLIISSVVVSVWIGHGAEIPGDRPERNKPAVSFKPQEMADALHAVIAADREVYAKYYDKLAQTGPTNMPAPAHLLRQASEMIQSKGAEFHYVLRSLWPINPKNAPETPTEKKGLQYVLDHPEATYYSEESLGGRRYFTAVYPDKAAVPSCVHCHNAHTASPRRDFKTGDVLGGIIVRVPLEF